MNVLIGGTDSSSHLAAAAVERMEGKEEEEEEEEEGEEEEEEEVEEEEVSSFTLSPVPALQPTASQWSGENVVRWWCDGGAMVGRWGEESGGCELSAAAAPAEGCNYFRCTHLPAVSRPSFVWARTGGNWRPGKMGSGFLLFPLPLLFLLLLLPPPPRRPCRGRDRERSR